MAEKPKIVMRFDQLGGVEIDAQCFVGSNCKEATKAMEQLFVTGGSNAKGSDKPEFFESGETNTNLATQRM